VAAREGSSEPSREAPPGGSSARPLWRDRDFGIFWVAQTLSVAGDSFAAIAVPLLILHATGSVAQMGLLTGVAGAAAVAAGIAAGPLADLLDRRMLLICCDLARMVLYGTIPLAWSFGTPIWLLYVVLPAGEAIGMVFQVTYVTAVRNLADPQQITEANGRLYATATAAAVLGPLLAGVVSGALGPTAAVAVDAASFALSAAGSFLIRLRRVEPVAGGARAAGSSGISTPRRRAWQELLAGARFLWRHRALRALTITLTLFIFLTYGLTDVLIFYLRHDLGQSYATVGVVLAVAAVGPVAGSAIAARLRRVAGFGATWIGGVAVCGIAVAFLGVSRSVLVVAALAATYLGCSAVSGICSMSLRQQVTPDHLLGRVTSAFWTIHFSLGPVGAAGLAWAAGRYGVTPVCAGAGAGCLLIAVVALFTPIRQAAPELASHATA
jgi:MFS family permease